VLRDYLEERADDYEGDIYDFAFREALRQNCADYVEEYYEDIDELNDMGDHSSYLEETDDAEIQDILLSVGAFRAVDYYDDYDFAAESWDGCVLSFKPGLQKEVFERLLERSGWTQEEAMEILAEGSGYDYGTLHAVGAALEDGKLVLKDVAGNPAGELRELLEYLGYPVSF